MSAIPSWARAHLDAHLPPGNPVINAQALGPRRLLANTRLGAVLLEMPAFGKPRMTFLEIPAEKLAFTCASCDENLQFWNLEVPATVYCSMCANEYSVDAEGRVTGLDGREAARHMHEHGPDCAHLEGHAADAGQAGHAHGHAGEAACCEVTGCCAEGCLAEACCADDMCECCVVALANSPDVDLGGGVDFAQETEADGAGVSDGTDLEEAALEADGLGGAGGATEELDGPHEAGAGVAGADEETLAVTSRAARAGAKSMPRFIHNGYTLFARTITTRNGSRTMYFFSKGHPKSGEPCDLPEGFEVGANERTGLPFLRRAAVEESAAPVRELPSYHGDVHPVADIEGIGSGLAARLGRVGITRTDALMRADTRALAKAVDVPEETVAGWQVMAELMMVKGIGGQYAEALAMAGISGIDELKRRSGAAIAKQVTAYLEAQELRLVGKPLTAARIEAWKNAAKAMRKTAAPETILA